MSALFFSLAAYILVDAFRWWIQHGVGFWSATTLLMLRFLTPVLWFVAFAALAATSAKKALSSRRRAGDSIRSV
jgi:hypothetical protein